MKIKIRKSGCGYLLLKYWLRCKPFLMWWASLSSKIEIKNHLTTFSKLLSYLFCLILFCVQKKRRRNRFSWNENKEWLPKQYRKIISDAMKWIYFSIFLDFFFWINELMLISQTKQQRNKSRNFQINKLLKLIFHLSSVKPWRPRYKTNKIHTRHSNQMCRSNFMT